MTERETLIGILNKPIFPHELADPLEAVADYLLDNGVTVPRWIPVEECLPETIACAAGTAYSEAVAVCTSGKKAMIAVWNGEEFLCAAYYWEAEDEYITHWMPLPPLPKEAPANG